MSAFFKIPNRVIDELGARLKPLEFMCLVIVIRKTRGWHKGRDPIALSQFLKLTGYKSRSPIIRALNFLSAPEVGLLVATRRKGSTTVYELGPQFDKIEGATSARTVTGTPPKNVTGTSTRTVTGTPRNLSPYATHKRHLNKIKEPNKNRGVKTKKENDLTVEVKDKENDLTVEACALARDRQGLIEAGLQLGIEPTELETVDDFQIRLLSSAMGRAADAMQSE